MQLTGISACKVIASLGLGSLAAFHLQCALTTLPALQAHTARQTRAQAAARPTRHLHLLATSGVSLAGLVMAAYGLSEQVGRHPYLYYVAGTALVSAGITFLGTARQLRLLAGQSLTIDRHIRYAQSQLARLFGREEKSIQAQADEALEAGALNGEALEATLVSAQRSALVGAGFSVLACVLSVVGNIGDRYQ